MTSRFCLRQRLDDEVSSLVILFCRSRATSRPLSRPIHHPGKILSHPGASEEIASPTKVSRDPGGDRQAGSCPREHPTLIVGPRADPSSFHDRGTTRGWLRANQTVCWDWLVLFGETDLNPNKQSRADMGCIHSCGGVGVKSTEHSRLNINRERKRYMVCARVTVFPMISIFSSFLPSHFSSPLFLSG